MGITSGHARLPPSNGWSPGPPWINSPHSPWKNTQLPRQPSARRVGGAPRLALALPATAPARWLSGAVTSPQSGHRIKPIQARGFDACRRPREPGKSSPATDARRAAFPMYTSSWPDIGSQGRAVVMPQKRPVLLMSPPYWAATDHPCSCLASLGVAFSKPPPVCDAEDCPS